jgi:recombination protein RecT
MDALATIEKDIYGVRERFVQTCTDQSITFEKESQYAMQIIAKSDYAIGIAMKSRQSVIDAIMNVAAIGLSLNPAKRQCYLVPRDGRICLDISYMGLIDLAIITGGIAWAKAEVVYSSHKFLLNGIDKLPTHDYNPFAKPDSRGEFVGVYVVAKMSDGAYLTDLMPVDEVNAIRDRSEAYKKGKGPWKSDYAEMAKKTIVKRAAKYWRGTDSHRLENAIDYLNTDGGEGLADLAKNDSPTCFDLVQASVRVSNAKTLEELAVIWKEEGAKATKDKNRGGFGALKNEVMEKRAALGDPKAKANLNATDVKQKDEPNEPN